MINCTLVHLENHLIVEGTLNIISNPLFKIAFYEIGIVQPYGNSFMATIRPGARLVIQPPDKTDKLVIHATLLVQGLLLVGGTQVNMKNAVLILDGRKAMIDVSYSIIKATDATSFIDAVQGTICGPSGRIELSFQNNNRSMLTLSPSCNENDFFPSILFIQGNFTAQLQTRIRNHVCDRITMINTNQNFLSYNADVSVSSAILDEDFVSRSALWQVFEGTNYISNGNQVEDIQYKYHNSSKASLRLGQFSNSSGVFIYKLCSPGTMIFGNECIMCNPGYFSTSGRPDSCKICVPGYFSAVVGSSQCSACLPGYVRNISMNADRCIPCPAGL
jgi:hypothetical protein